MRIALAPPLRCRAPTLPAWLAPPVAGSEPGCQCAPSTGARCQCHCVAICRRARGEEEAVADGRVERLVVEAERLEAGDGRGDGGARLRLAQARSSRWHQPQPEEYYDSIKLVVPPRAEHVIHPGARGLSASQADKDRGYVELKGDKKAFIANGGLGRPPGMMCLLLMTARETSPTREVPRRPSSPRGPRAAACSRRPPTTTAARAAPAAKDGNGSPGGRPRRAGAASLRPSTPAP